MSFALALLLLAAPSAELVTHASGVRLRDKASPSGKEVAKIGIGTVLSVLEKSATEQKVGDDHNYWYRVKTQDGAQGWVFGAFTEEWDPKKGHAWVVELVEQKNLVDTMSLSDRDDLLKMLARRAAETKDPAQKAELELMRFRGLAKAAASIPIDQLSVPLNAAWTKAQGNDLVFSEPAGQWFVNGTRLWDLEVKYHALPIADEIAWAAAQTPIAGECEGYLPCYISIAGMTNGEYLARHPKGKHVAEAVKELAQGWDASAAKEADAETKKDAKDVLKELREKVSKAGDAAKPALKAIADLEKAL
jgi:hypothetical protein